MRLLPGSENEPLVCLLDVVDLGSDDVKYTAISYAWGDTPQKKPLRCNNEILMIPESLFSALHRQRENEIRQTFWVDAVCISQSEDPDALEERAQQIQMMDKIFSGAEMVLIDLGEQPKAYYHYLDCAFALLNFGIDNINMQMFSNKDMPEELAKLRLDSAVWDAYDDMSTRPWYRRVWVMQEYVLAKEIGILVRRVVHDFELFRNFAPMFDWFLLHLRAMEMQTPETPSRASKVDVDLQTRSREAKQFVQDCRKIHEQSTKVPLTDFLRAALELDTTDPRDRLYGGYGIIDRSIMQRLPVDYGISSETLSQRLSTLLLQEGEEQLLLELCVGVNDRLPSWCIDICRRPRGRDNSTMGLSREHGVYTANGKSQQEVSATANPQVIAWSGCPIGKVKSLHAPISLPSH